MFEKDAAIFTAYARSGVDPIPYFTECLGNMDEAITKFFYQALTILTSSYETRDVSSKSSLMSSAQFYYSEGASLVLTYKQFLKEIGKTAFKSPFQEEWEKIETIGQLEIYWKELDGLARSIAAERAKLNEQAGALLP